MKCLFCKGEMKKGDTPVHIGRNGCHVTLDRVPAWVCAQCGESYFEAAEVVPFKTSSTPAKKKMPSRWQRDDSLCPFYILLSQHKHSHLHLSQKPNQSLSETARKIQSSQWLKDNKNALDAYNRRIESRGTFSDGLRTF